MALGSSYGGGMTTRPVHPKLRLGKPQSQHPKGRRLALLPKGEQNGTQSFLPLTTANVRQIAASLPQFDSVTVLIQLVNGDKLHINYNGKPHLVWLA